MRRKGRKAKEEILENRRSRQGNGKTERKEGSLMKKQGWNSLGMRKKEQGDENMRSSKGGGVEEMGRRSRRRLTIGVVNRVSGSRRRIRNGEESEEE